MLFTERILEISAQTSLGEIFNQTRDLIINESSEVRKNLLENEEAMDLLTGIIQGFDGPKRVERAKELANSFGEDSFQNLEAYDYFAKTLGLKTSVQ